MRPMPRARAARRRNGTSEDSERRFVGVGSMRMQGATLGRASARASMLDGVRDRPKRNSNGLAPSSLARISANLMRIEKASLTHLGTLERLDVLWNPERFAHRK